MLRNEKHWMFHISPFISFSSSALQKGQDRRQGTSRRWRWTQGLNNSSCLFIRANAFSIHTFLFLKDLDSIETHLYIIAFYVCIYNNHTFPKLSFMPLRHEVSQKTLGFYRKLWEYDRWMTMPEQVPQRYPIQTSAHLSGPGPSLLPELVALRPCIAASWVVRSCRPDHVKTVCQW